MLNSLAGGGQDQRQREGRILVEDDQAASSSFHDVMKANSAIRSRNDGRQERGLAPAS